jgi:hypothetical protein
MKQNTLTLLIQLAGVAHIGLICAGAAMPRVVKVREHIKILPPFLRQLFWVYYSFIGLCLVGFGIISIALATPLASGAPLARGICIFLTAFWTLRLIAATVVFDVRPYLQTRALQLGYQSTNVVFIFLPIVYALAAWKGGGP